MKALIDGDSLIWQIGYTHQEAISPYDFDLSCEQKIREIKYMADADSTHIFFSDKKNNIRKGIYKVRKYKGNRTAKKPDWFINNAETIKKSLEGFCDFSNTSNGGYEADDLIYREQIRLNYKGIICSIDKDLDQIVGKHCNYNQFDKGSHYLYDIDEKAAFLCYAKLCLIGDSADNIVGIPRFGDLTFNKFMNALKSRGEELTETAIISVYIDYYNEYYGNIIYNETRDVVRLYENSF